MTLLQTSVTPRPLAPAYVRRPRLVKRISHGLSRGLVMIIAPGGFGKTSLAAEWFEAGEGPERGWVTLSDKQNTPEELLTQLIHAVRTVRPGVLESTLAALERGEPMADPDGLTMTINELCDLEPTTLVLDDLDAITDRTTLETLAFLLDNLPPSLSTITCSRRDPLLPLARWRSSGRMTGIRAAELRFDEDEAGLLLDLLAAGELSESQCEAILNAADGWPTGVYLAGSAAANRHLGSPPLGDLGAGVSAISDFFVDEVLDQMPPAWRSTLIETSILDSVTGPMAAAVTGREDAPAILTALSEAGMFVAQSPIDRESFRVHAMLQGFLRSLLSDEHTSEDIAELHLRAAAELVRTGRYLAAVEHANQARDSRLVEDLLDEHGLEILERDPNGLSHALQSIETEERPLSDLDLFTAMIRADREEVILLATRRPVSVLQNAALGAVEKHLRGDMELATCPAKDLEGLPAGWTDLYRGLAFTVSERYQEGENRLLAAAATPVTDTFLTSASLAALAWNNALAGKLGAARTFALQAVDHAERKHHPWFYGLGWARLALAQVAYDQGRLEEAHRLASSVASQHPLDDAARVESSILLSRIVWALGDRSSARSVLNQGFTGAEGRPITGVLALRLALGHCSLSLLEHDPAVATTWLPDWEHRIEHGPSLPTERLILAQLLIQHDREEEARELLAAPEVQADRSHRSVLQSWKLAAVAAHQANDPAAPMALEIAVSMAQTEGFVQMFAEDRTTVSKVGRPTASGVTVALSELQMSEAERAANTNGAPHGSRSSLIEDLTDRELSVLRYMPTRLSNREIAEELFVSVNTVKSHIKSIYRKLAVTSRREAVARAAALRLM